MFHPPFILTNRLHLFMVWLMSWLVSSHERGIIYVVKNENYVTEKRQKKKNSN